MAGRGWRATGRDFWRVTAGRGAAEVTPLSPHRSSALSPRLRHPTWHPKLPALLPPNVPIPAQSSRSVLGEPSEHPGHLCVSPKCHLHPSCPLLPSAEPPLVTQAGSKIRTRAQEEPPGPLGGGRTTRGGVPKPRAPSETPGGHPRSPALAAGPVAAVTAVSLWPLVALGAPWGQPPAPTRLLGRRCRISRRCHRRREGRGSGRAEDGGERSGRCHLRRGLKRGPVELDGASSCQGLRSQAHTRMRWLLSAARGGSDGSGLVGGVGEAGEVGGLGVAH